jgi:hypothetical protein
MTNPEPEALLQLFEQLLPTERWEEMGVHERSRSFPFATLRVRITPPSFLTHFGGPQADGIRDDNLLELAL